MNNLDLSSYEYEFSKELIAQKPLEQRDNSRLMVLDRATGAVTHSLFADITKYLTAGDCLVLNRTKVVPARLFGKKETGGKVEALFLDPVNMGRAGGVTALLKPFIDPGKKIIFPGGLTAKVEARTDNREAVLVFEGADPQNILNEYGIMPLPPYIKRKEADGLSRYDMEHYQTVYAAENGSIAAPTAGFHFTNELIEKLKARGVRITAVVLHVGWGTFRPVTSNDISKHAMLPEHFEISDDAAVVLNEARAAGKRIIAAGTTTVRALESAACREGFSEKGFEPIKGETSMFIYPGYRFKAIDAMITNFHLPHSTPLFMVSALAGRENILNAYREAVSNKYRFYSYGDAMLIT